MNDNTRNSSDSSRASLRACLLARHAAATPQLDALRQAVLSATLARHTAENAPVPASQLLRALFLPHRRLWTTLAATWALLLALRLLNPAPTPSPFAATDPQLATTSASPSSAARPARLANSTSFAERQAQLHALLR